MGRLLLRLRERLRSIMMSMSVCGSVCLSVREDISGATRSIFANFCALPVSVARSSSGTFAIARIAYRQEGVFPIENALSVGKGGCIARAN